MKRQPKGTPAADVIAHLPPWSLSGIVYLGSFFSTENLGQYLTTLCVEKVQVLVSPESDADAIRANIVAFHDAIFDLLTDSNASELRRLDRWDIQSTWLGYAWNQTTADRRYVASRKQDPEPLFALGKTGFPVLVVHGNEDMLVSCENVVKEAKKHFTNLEVHIMTGSDGNHAPFYENPGEVMVHIGSFVKKIQVS